MFRRQITRQPVSGKIQEARQWAQETKEYFDKKNPQTATEIYMEQFENYSTIHWFQQFESLADLEKIAAQIESDEEAQAILTKELMVLYLPFKQLSSPRGFGSIFQKQELWVPLAAEG